MKIAGLDIGTTGCKLTVFDEQGHDLGKAYRDYPVRRQVSGHEIDISVVMDSVYAVIGEMVTQNPDIGGIGITSFGETFVMTDAQGTPLHTAMLYTDPRGAEECAALVEKLGADSIARISGLAPHEMYSICKIMWLKKHQPEVYQAAKHIFLIGDYVAWHLTGVAQIDYSLATAADVDVSLLSKPVPTGTPAGYITKTAAEKTELNSDCQIVTVSHDQVAAAVGAGAFDGDTAVDGAGTVECLTPIYDSLPDIAVMSKGYFSVVPYVVPGKYVAYAFSYTGGALIQWCVNTFAKAEQEKAKEQGVSVNTYLEQHYEKQEPTGLLVLPHFAGAATPYMDTGSKGAILGLTAGTTLPEIYRACMEGVAYEMRLNYDAIANSGIHFTKLHATGGGAKSKVWMQMKADILNLPITSLKTSDAGTVGSAMLTGVAVGVFKDLAEAASVMVRQRETYLPDPKRHEQYMRIYERYRKVYQAVRPLM